VKLPPLMFMGRYPYCVAVVNRVTVLLYRAGAARISIWNTVHFLLVWSKGLLWVGGGR
jgi:hypothetical protein